MIYTEDFNIPNNRVKLAEELVYSRIDEYTCHSV